MDSTRGGRFGSFDKSRDSPRVNASANPWRFLRWIPMGSASVGANLFKPREIQAISNGIELCLDYLRGTGKVHKLEAYQFKVGTSVKL